MSPWIEAIAWTLIHFVWQGTLIALATAGALRVCRTARPQIRYTVACAGLALMLGAAAVTATIRTGTVNAAPFSALASAADLAAAPGAFPDRIGDAARPGVRSATDAVVAPAPLLTAIVWIWLAGVSLLMVRLAGGCWRVHRLRRTALASTASPWQAAAERLARRLGVAVRFRVVASVMVDAPIVAGWVKPLIVLPIAALANMTTAQIDALIAHELAHIRRHDYIVNLLQTAAEALLFFHPAVWWVSRRIRQEREHCCDDIAVGVAEEAAVYVEALALLAAAPTRAIGPSLGAADGALLRRARRLLGVQDEEQRPGFDGLVLLGAAASLALVLLSAASSAVAQPQQPDAARRTRVTDHFEISYPTSLDLHAKRIAEEAEQAYGHVSGDLRHHLSFKIPLLLFPSTTGMQSAAKGATGTQNGAAGNRVFFAVDRPADQWSGLLTHEVTHLFSFDILPGQGTPAWIHEGLAEYERNAWDPADLVTLRSAVRANTVPRLAVRPPDAAAGPRFVDVFGHAVFDFIESRWGKAGIRQLLLAVRQANGADPLQTALQLSTSEFDEAFQTYLRTRLADNGAATPESRFDVATTMEVEGVLSVISVPSNPQLACMELIVPAVRDDAQRWSIECGEARAEEVIAGLKLGERIVVSRVPSATPSQHRLLIRRLVRPADGYVWTGRG